MSVRPPESHEHDDDFVDARLRSALQHAPDGDARPSAALRQAVLQAARASLPPKPTWWRRLLDNGPSMQRAWATAAGIGAFGLALNLAWHMTSAPPSDEYSRSPVASVSESVSPGPQAPPPAVMADRQAAKAATGAAAGALEVPQSAAPPAQSPLARRDAAPTPATPPKRAEPAPTVVATAPQPFPAPPAAPAPAAPPRPGEADSEAKKALAKEEYARFDRAADVAAANAAVDKAMADERRRSFAPPADAARSEDLAAAAKPAPAAEAQARVKQAPSASMGIAQAPAAPAPPAPSAWPEPLARLQLAFSQADDWPGGWTMQGSAEVAVPRRAWWQAMLAGTAGRWQVVQEPVPQSVPGSLTWHMRDADGTRFTLMLADGQAWLQSAGTVWRAPWSVLPAPLPR